MPSNTESRLSFALFLLPAIVLVGVFVYAFLCWSVGISLTDWNTVGKFGRFIGLRNYGKLFREDPLFLRALTQTLETAVLFIIITIPLGAGCAILLDLGVRMKSLFRTIYLIPLSFSFVASATMWSWMFLPENGAINTLLKMVHLDALRQPWLTSTKESLLSIVLVYVWQFCGFSTLVYYAGISSVSVTQIEASVVDGASTFQKYTRIILPQQLPATLTVLLLLLMYSLRVFDLTWLMTGGGPAHSSEVLATYMYRVTFDYNRFAYGSAISSFMFVVSVVIIVLPVMTNYLMAKRKRAQQ